MMLFELLRSYAIWFLVSVAVCIAGVSVTLILDPAQARIFLVSYVYYWNGLLVAMSGFGALHFGMTTYRQQFHYLVVGTLNITGHLHVAIIAELDRLYSIRNKQYIAIPVLIVGMTILYICGYPMTGFPKYFLWFSSSFMFYAGGLMLAYGILLFASFTFLKSISGTSICKTMSTSSNWRTSTYIFRPCS
jgi:hypothetical protein